MSFDSKGAVPLHPEVVTGLALHFGADRFMTWSARAQTPGDPVFPGWTSGPPQVQATQPSPSTPVGTVGLGRLVAGVRFGPALW